MKRDRTIEVVQLLIVAGMFVLAALAWPEAPDRIPVHWNAAGQADRYGGKFEGLFGMPLVALALYVALRYVPRIDPGRANYAGFSRAYAAIRVLILLGLAGFYGAVHLSLRGYQVEMATIVPLLVGLLFIALGGLMGKLRPNWFIGIRTPWTLSSKTAWTRTHRIGGWLFILFGVVILGAVLVMGPQRGPSVIIGGAVLIALWSMVYSYVVWRSDPHKVPPAGTLPADRGENASSQPDPRADSQPSRLDS